MLTFLYIVIVFLLVFANGFFVASEFALVGVRALAISWPMEAFYKVFRWPIRLLDWAGTRTVRLLGLNPTSDHASVYTEEELRHLI